MSRDLGGNFHNNGSGSGATRRALVAIPYQITELVSIVQLFSYQRDLITASIYINWSFGTPDSIQLIEADDSSIFILHISANIELF
jgi:hypothetical protein